MRNFKRCICKNKIRPNSAICYFSAASVKLMRFHGGNWHKIQLKGSPFLLCYSSFMPPLISEEPVCHGEENPTKSVYHLVLSLCPIYKYIQWDSSEKGVFIFISSLIDAKVKAIVYLSADFRHAASGGPWHEKDVVTFNWLWYPAFAAKQALLMRIGLLGKARSTKSRGQVCLQLFIVLLSKKLEITEMSYVKSDEKEILKITLKIPGNYLEILSFHQELQFWWRLKLLLCTDLLQYCLPLNILVFSNKPMWFYQKIWVKLLCISKVRSLSSIWKDQRRACLDIAAESCRADSSCGGNTYSQMWSRAPKLIALWLLSVRAEVKSQIWAAEGIEASKQRGSSGYVCRWFGATEAHP